MKPIIHVDDVALERHEHGEKFEARDGSVSAAIGARQIGCSLTVVPPGKRAYPFHCHHVNEEMFVILEGAGTLRIGKSEYPVRAGDVIAAPAGGADTAHQLVNTSERDLRYLSMSTNIPMDVIEYPDSSKYAVRAGRAPERTFSTMAKSAQPVDYWEDE